MLLYLPDLVMWKICDFLSYEDIIRLCGSDWRIDIHRKTKHRSAEIIKKRWKHMITRGREYNKFSNSLSITSELRCHIQVLTLVDLIKSPLRYHTVFPRRRIVIPRCKFDKIDMIISRRGTLICEFNTVPPVELYIRANGTRFQVTNESVIPINVLQYTTLVFDIPAASYICYTEVYLDFQTANDLFKPEVLECLNTNAVAWLGTMVPSVLPHKYPNLIPQ